MCGWVCSVGVYVCAHVYYVSCAHSTTCVIVYRFVWVFIFISIISSLAQVLLAPGNITAVSGNIVDLACLAYGIPLPNITWTKNGVPLNNNSITGRITTYEGVIVEGGVALARSFLQICSLQTSDDGQYSCVADNSIGIAATSDFELLVNVPGMATWTQNYSCMIKHILMYLLMDNNSCTCNFCSQLSQQ